MSVLETVRNYSRRLWGGWGIFWTTFGVLLLAATAGQKAAKARRKAGSLRELEKRAGQLAQVHVTEKMKEMYATEAAKAGAAATASEARATELEDKIKAAKARAAAIRARLKGGQ